MTPTPACDSYSFTVHTRIMDYMVELRALHTFIDDGASECAIALEAYELFCERDARP